MTGYAAYLRVYEPLTALPPRERRRWADYVAQQRAPRPSADLEHQASLAAVLAVPPRVVPAGDVEHAYVQQIEAVTYICPWRLRLRCWEALEAFRSQLPDEIADAFVPPAVADAAEQDHLRWQTEHPDVRAPILTSTWQVPIPWFVLFEADERRLTLGTGAATAASPTTGVDRALVYLTAMSRARRRLARALAVVRRTFEQGPAVDGLEELGRWLEEFHPHSVVELDYGGLVHLVDDGTLTEDSSVADMAKALVHLSAGRAADAVTLYEAVADRWRSIASAEQAN